MRVLSKSGSARRFASDQSPTSAIVKNFAFRMAILGVNFGTGITVARSLAPLGRGEQTALVLWPILLPSLATLGIPAAIIYRTRQRSQDAGRLYFVAMAICFAVGLLVAALGAAIMPQLLQGYDPQLVRYAQWFMLFTPQVLLQLVSRAYLEASGKFTLSILSQLVPTLFTLGALLALREAGTLTPPTAAICYLLPASFVAVWLIAHTRARMDVDFRSFRADAAALLSYGLRSYGADVINALSAQLDLAIIIAFLNPVALGLYSVAITIARLLFIVQSSLMSVLFPHASGLEPNQAIALLGRTARLSLTTSILFGAGLTAIAFPLLPLVYGASFAAALPLIPLLTIEAILAGLCWVLGTAFQTTGRPATVTLIQAGWLASALALLVVLVPRMQTSGAAVALVIASFIRLALIAVAYRVVLHRSLPRLWPDAADAAFVYAKMRALGARHHVRPAEI